MKTWKLPRDSQRSKVYAAENTLPEMWADELHRPDDIEVFLSRVLSHPAVKEQFGVQGVRLQWKRAGSHISTAHKTKFLIRLAPSHRSRMILLHELAHILAPLWSQHDRQYCEVYVFLVETIMGREVAKRLKAAFKAGGVKYRPKRQLTAEQREAARVRLAINLGRAA